jgi:MoaA/NifB/PqqE/SkfB family radical SAM enzyme
LAESAFPSTPFIETTTRCNLACPMCVRTGPGWRGGSGDMSPAVFERLSGLFSQARAVVLNGMGEPLLHPELPRMVARVKELLPPEGWCGLQINGLPLTKELARALATAGLDALCVSHDAGAAFRARLPGRRRALRHLPLAARPADVPGQHARPARP